MKKTKKCLSVLLSIALILTSVSAGLTAFAASGVSEEQWTTLIDTLKNDNVASVGYTGTDGNYVLSDPDGSVLTAMDAFFAVFSGLADTNGDNGASSSVRTIDQVRNQIKTELNTRMNPTEFVRYNVDAVINIFTANAPEVDKTDSRDNQLTEVTTTVAVRTADTVLLQYEDLNALPDEISTATVYTFRHVNQHHTTSESSGCGSTTVNWYFLGLATPERSAGGVITKTQLLGYAQELAAYEDLYNADFAALVDLGLDEIAAVRADLVSIYNTVLSSFSTVVYRHFYGDYDVPALVEALDSAAMVYSYIPITEEIVSLCQTDTSDFTFEELEALYEEIRTRVDAYNATPAEVRDYIESHDIYNPADTADVIDAIRYQVELVRIAEYKELVDADLALYADYDEDAVLAGEISYEQLDLAAGAIRGRYEAMSQFKAETVAEVCGADYMDNLKAVSDELARLVRVSDYDSRFAERYAYFIGTVFVDTNLDDSSSELLGAVANYDYWYTELQAFIAEIRESVGDATADRIMESLDAEMTDYMDSKYNVLNARLETEVYTAAALYDDICTLYGEVVSIASLDTYNKLDSALGQIEHDIYEFLEVTENYELDSDLVSTYQRLSEIVLDDYYAFKETGGFDRYQQSFMEEIIRYADNSELARDQDYVVTDEKAETVIDLLDVFFTSDEFAAMTGADVTGTITGVLDNLYTDEFINTVVQYLYPIVANEFVKVWATLPANISLTGVDTGNSLMPSADVDCDLHLMTVEEAMNTLGLYLFPTTLGAAIADSYPDVAEALMQATTAATVDSNPWEDPAIVDPETGALNLQWGVTDRESFLQAATAALSGLEPLLLALLANQPMELRGGIGTGSGTVSGKALGFLDVSGPLTVDPIELVLSATANEGYNNAVAPILEALGVTAPNGNDFASTRDVLEKGLLVPIETLLANLGNAPVDTILRMLPNIAYAVSAGLVTPLLGMLKTDISYTTNAQYSTTIVGQTVTGSLNDIYKSDAPIAINLEDMIDLSSMGVDISSFDAFFDMLTGLIGVELPAIDYATLATLGELTWKDTVRSEKQYAYGEDGKAAYIEANRADVLVFVLDYVINAIAADDQLINKLAAAFGAATPVELPAAVEQIIQNVIADGDSAIAAVCELVLPMEHSAPEADIDWLSEVSSSVTYSDKWTKEKAEYVAENLPSFVDNVLKLVGVKINGVKAEDLPMLVELGLDSLYTPDMVNSLASTLANAFASVNLGAFGDMLKEQIGLDFHYWDNYTADFAAGDQAAFLAAMVDVLKPFEGILTALLCDEDLTLSVTDATGAVQIIHVLGFDGYTNGVIPLLEALGAEGVLTPEAFHADREHILENILIPLFSVLDKVAADPYSAVTDLIPNVLYFIASGGLSVSVNNIAHAAFIALDTIAPIYDVDLNGLLGFDIRFTDSDPIALLSGLIGSAIYDATGVDLDFDFTSGSMLDSLAFGDLVSFTSANGKTAYRVDTSSAAMADVLTAVLRFAVREIVFSGNAAKLADLAKEQFELSEETYAFLYSILDVFDSLLSDMGTDAILGLVFWVFYGADNAADAAVDYYEYMYCDWAELIDLMASSEISYIQKAGMLMRNVYANSFMPFFDQLADEKDLPIDSKDILGFIDIFHEFIELFKEIIAKIQSFFASLA